MAQDTAQENERDQASVQGSAPLEEYELANGRAPYLLTMTEFKLLGIAGVGFFLDGQFFLHRRIHQNLTRCFL